ncbi:MAG: carboxylating nicotinate-nucleotide diphosphorylase [Leptospiraceae bacterium]|nr:carboxylating nicotinate-nucleotide diphosphorylase [Leptospiraceae bacterium]MDW7975260.1 carboxylating nicotinate-nucleotide diphosphorylase [Leptospiraceae bacterium]
MQHHFTSPVVDIKRADVEDLIKVAIYEDAPDGDITSETLFDRNHFSFAKVISKSKGIFCGNRISGLLIEIFNEIANYNIKILNSLQDGDEFLENQELLKLKGETAGLLRIERVLLNFIQLLSGISTQTHKVIQAIQGINKSIFILDTRKTIPGFRILSKYAVYCGGGSNHRIHLSDMAMIKENHLSIGLSLKEAVRQIKSKHPTKPIEIEVQDFRMIEEVLSIEPDIIMLDNFSIEEIKKAVELIEDYCNNHSLSKPKIEISGGWRPDKFYLLKDLENIGVSMGYLTHNVQFLDMSMDFETL